MPVTKCVGTNTIQFDGNNLEAEFLTPSFGPSDHQDVNNNQVEKVKAEPSSEVKAPSLGASRFKVNVLKERHMKNAQKSRDICIDYNSIVG